MGAYGLVMWPICNPYNHLFPTNWGSQSDCIVYTCSPCIHRCTAEHHTERDSERGRTSVVRRHQGDAGITAADDRQLVVSSAVGVRRWVLRHVRCVSGRCRQDALYELDSRGLPRGTALRRQHAPRTWPFHLLQRVRYVRPRTHCRRQNRIFDFVASIRDKIVRVDSVANRGRFCRLWQNRSRRSRFCRQCIRGLTVVFAASSTMCENKITSCRKRISDTQSAYTPLVGHVFRQQKYLPLENFFCLSV